MEAIDERYYRGMYTHAKYRRKLLDYITLGSLVCALLYLILTFHGPTVSYQLFVVLDFVLLVGATTLLLSCYGDFLLGSPEMDIIYIKKNE
jgi:hypothetical protein